MQKNFKLAAIYEKGLYRILHLDTFSAQCPQRAWPLGLEICGFTIGYALKKQIKNAIKKSFKVCCMYNQSIKTV